MGIGAVWLQLRHRQFARPARLALSGIRQLQERRTPPRGQAIPFHRGFPVQGRILCSAEPGGHRGPDARCGAGPPARTVRRHHDQRPPSAALRAQPHAGLLHPLRRLASGRPHPLHPCPHASPHRVPTPPRPGPGVPAATAQRRQQRRRCCLRDFHSQASHAPGVDPAGARGADRRPRRQCRHVLPLVAIELLARQGDRVRAARRTCGAGQGQPCAQSLRVPSSSFTRRRSGRRRAVPGSRTKAPPRN